MTAAIDLPAPAILAVDPELVVGNRQEFKQRILDALNSGQRRFIIDFTNARYVDATGLGVLVSCRKQIIRGKGELVLAGLNDDLCTLFELTGLTSVFRITDTVGRAAQMLSA